MKIHALLAILLLSSLALAQAIATSAQPGLIYVHLTKPGITLSAQPLTLAVPTELRSGEGGIAASYASPTTQGMFVVLGNDGNEIYLQIESKYSGFLAEELKWLIQIGALQGITESDISQISSLAATSREISYSTSGWAQMQTLAATQLPPVASKMWEERAASEAANPKTADTPAAAPTQVLQIPPEQQSLPSATTGATSQGAEDAAQKTSASDTLPQKTTGAFDATATQPQKGIFDLASMLAPLLTAAAVILVAIVAVLLRSPNNEQIEAHRILSSPTRVEILNELSTNEKIPTDLSSRLKKSKATVIEHLERMREAGFVEKVQTPGKKFVYYRITSKGKTALLRSAA